MVVQEKTAKAQATPRKPKNPAIQAKIRELLKAVDNPTSFRLTCSILELSLLERLRDEQAGRLRHITDADKEAVEGLYERMISLKRSRKGRPRLL